MDLHQLLNPTSQPSTPQDALIPQDYEINVPPRAERANRDLRLRILTMRECGLSYSQISARTGATQNQIQYTVYLDKVTPRKAPGSPPKLLETEIDDIIAWISSTRRNRRMPHWRVVQTLGLQVNASTLTRSLARRGYFRRKALRKPPLTAAHREDRKAWCSEHVDKPLSDWYLFLFTDESWVNSEYHKRIYVTRCAGEELDDTCLRSRHQWKRGWMFWGSFHGNIKGPGLFWEKDWGTIKSRSYCERIVPLIKDYISQQSQQGQDLQLMQDSAPGHASAETRAFMTRQGLRPIYWPSRSPDLNPIESIWDKIKDWIDDRLPSDDRDLAHPELRQLVQGAWDSITPEQLHREISKMPGKCRAVINADGGHIKG